MASGMTKTQLVRHLAEKVGTNNKTAATFLEHTTAKFYLAKSAKDAIAPKK